MSGPSFSDVVSAQRQAACEVHYVLARMHNAENPLAWVHDDADIAVHCRTLYHLVRETERLTAAEPNPDAREQLVNLIDETNAAGNFITGLLNDTTTELPDDLIQAAGRALELDAESNEAFHQWHAENQSE